MPEFSDAVSGRLASRIKALGATFGFDKVGISATDLTEDAIRLERWLALRRNGRMAYMAAHGSKRSRPAALVEGTRSIISARMNYLPEGLAAADECLNDPNRAYVARYALGRDYHKTLRRRLRQLALAIESLIGPYGYRVFVDSAPVLEKAVARKAGLGWIGKHTNLLDRSVSSWFLIGEIYTDLPLPPDNPVSDHCGSCTACIDACPTRAIVAPYELDARRCISYLTIELRGSIPVELRPAIGNRIFGCDDCQLVCPWNKYAQRAQDESFMPRHSVDTAQLTELFAWTEEIWSERTAGSALRRPGYEGWLRNIAVALGNAPTSDAVVASLAARREHASSIVAEHVRWALERHGASAQDFT
jgi:epoxyqueuosine reductase